MESIGSEARGKIAVLIESYFDETEFRRFNEFFPLNGYGVEYVSYLWGKPSLTFHGNSGEENVIVTTDANHVSPLDYAGIVLIDGYAMDRLRYEEHIHKGDASHAPAVEFLRKAVEAMIYDQLVIGASGHALWLFCAAPELLRGRRVTCVHNIVSDIQNAGGLLALEGDQAANTVVDDNLITAKDPSVVEEYLGVYLEELHRLERLAARLAA